MECKETTIPGCWLIKPDVFKDGRGFFFESYSKHWEPLKEIQFVQDNQSFTIQKGTIRGLHCQKNPHAQLKLIRCTKGAILDVVVDVRKSSPTYLKHLTFELSESNFHQVLIPKGCLHGFVTLVDDCMVQYKVDEYYNKESDRSIRFDDPIFGVDWGELPHNLSDKDRQAPLYKDSDIDFQYE